MNKIHRRIFTSLLAASCGLVIAGGFVGCAKEKSTEKQVENKSGNEDPALKDLPEDQRKALMELSADDRKLALEQKICPVGDKPLGSMGKPIPVDIDGKRVFVCCGGCQKPLEADPKKYLAKLKKSKE